MTSSRRGQTSGRVWCTGRMEARPSPLVPGTALTSLPVLTETRDTLQNKVCGTYGQEYSFTIKDFIIMENLVINELMYMFDKNTIVYLKC